MRNALFSVSDKTGIEEFARALEKLGFRILSTGGTYKILEKAGIKNILEIADFTGFPEGLEGRIKTLTPQVFGGILNLRNKKEHQDFCEKNDIQNIDLVVVNLYPFKETYYKEDKNFEEKVEQIDIGGPSMIRAAAKNYAFCAPVVDPKDYEMIIHQYQAYGDLSLSIRKHLATKVFEMTAQYDLLIAKFWEEETQKMPLRYGENPHQSAVILSDPFVDGADLIQSEILNGKPMSYNNFSDANGALELALSFKEPFACIIKHASPCCASVGETLEDAFEKAYEKGDSLSAFGGVIALNQKVDSKTAEKIVSFFNEIVLAPDYEEEALEILKTKKNLRVLKVPHFQSGQTPDIAVKKIRGGMLVQDLDTKEIKEKDLKIVSEKKPNAKEIQDLLIAWRLVKIVKSNAIAIVKEGTLIGSNGGQTSRVDAMKNALSQAGEDARGAVLASDAFFPFPDAVEQAGKYGISGIIQPGGSKNDPVVFETADKAGISMVLSETRAFLH